MFSRDSASMWLQVFVLIGMVCLVGASVQQRNEIRRLIQVQAGQQVGVPSSPTTSSTQGITVGEPHPVDFSCGSPENLLQTSVRAALDQELGNAGWLTTKDAPSAYVCVKPGIAAEPILAVTNDCSDKGPCSFEAILMFDPISKTLSPIAKEPTSEMLSAGIVISRVLGWSPTSIQYQVRGNLVDGGCSELEIAQSPWFTDKTIDLRNYEERTVRRCFQKSCAAANIDSTDLRCE